MIPNLFTKQDIPSNIPEILENKISEILKNTKNKEEFLHESFFYIVEKRCGCRRNLICKFGRLFEKDISKVIDSEGYLHCTTMNFILRIMAVKSGLFSDKDIKLRLTNSRYMAPHQYLQIRLSENQTISLDPRNYQFGIDYGKFGSGFDSVKMCPIR